MRFPTLSELKLKAKKFVPSLNCVFCPRVIDGDSLECVAYCDDAKTLYKFNVRVRGVDTPEMRSKDPEERECAHRAKAYTEQQALGRKLELERVAHDKYGRILADIRLSSGELLHNLIIDSGHGVTYDGGKKPAFKKPAKKLA